MVIAGGPGLGSGPLPERLARFRDRYDHFRSAIVQEPRGSEAVVAALLCEPHDSTCTAGVIFFNNVGYLGMCGHGTIGLAVTLTHLGRIASGAHRIETPVGVVTIEVHSASEVTVHNVPSFRTQKQVVVSVPGYGDVHGDVAWGGNWFFLTNQSPLPISISQLSALTTYTEAIKSALRAKGITGANGAEIDHIDVHGPADIAAANSKNFVLCPGNTYDRSPCGTGTSAKLACLQADGHLAEGSVWTQQSVIGSIFEGSYQWRNGQVHPSIRGSAFITAESTLILNAEDPFRWGIPMRDATTVGSE